MNSSSESFACVSDPYETESFAHIMKRLMGAGSSFETPEKLYTGLQSGLLEEPLKKNIKSMFDEAPSIPVLNHALQQIGLSVLEQYFDAISKFSADPIVSIGSGNGYVERHMEQLFGKSIYCVDPNHVPNTNSELYKTSEYDDVYNLLESKSDLCDQSTMFINWSSPNESTYDFEAIKAMNPNNVLIVFESTGSGGGRILQKWLNFCGMVTDEEPTQSDITLYSFPKYHVVHSTLSRVERPPHGQFEYAIVWLSKTPIEVDTSSILTYVGTEIPRKSFNPLDMLMDSLMMNISSISKKYGMDDEY